MATDYTADAAAALEMLQEYGVPCVLRRPAGGALNPVSETRAAGGPADYPAVGVQLRAPADPAMSAADRAQVYSRQRVILLAASGLPVDPAPGDLFPGPTFEGASWNVLGCQTLRPDGATAILHRVLVER